MSEIVIKGMEMPKDCEECQIATVKSYSTWCPLKKCHIKKGYSFRDCPLVELSPHGRLIDADAFKQLSKDKFIKCAVEIADGTIIACKAFPMKQFFDLIDRTPTVLEANHEH